MGPSKGSDQYEEQAEQVRTFLCAIDARSPEEEDGIIALFAPDPTYSREAIMDGVGRWRSALRTTKEATA
jgi:hypothetical protein